MCCQFISNFVTFSGGLTISEDLGRKSGPGQANWMPSSYPWVSNPRRNRDSDLLIALPTQTHTKCFCAHHWPPWSCIRTQTPCAAWMLHFRCLLTSECLLPHIRIIYRSSSTDWHRWWSVYAERRLDDHYDDTAGTNAQPLFGILCCISSPRRHDWCFAYRRIHRIYWVEMAFHHTVSPEMYRSTSHQDHH